MEKKTPKPRDGEKLFRVYWGQTTGESLVWAKSQQEAMKQAGAGDDFDFVEHETVFQDYPDILEIVELDEADTQEILAEQE